MMDGLKRGSAAIVGVAESDIGQVAEGLSVFDLMAQGVGRALDDCGLKLKDVDGLFSATTQSRLSVLGLAEYLGINPPYLGSTIVGGSSFERGDLGATQGGSALQYAIERRPGVPVDLIHGPGSVGRFLQLLDAPRIVALELGCERRPRRNELIERPLIEVVDSRFE